MKFAILATAWPLLVLPWAAIAQTIDIDAPAHAYRQRPPQDRFTQLEPDFESGKMALDTSSDKAFLRDLLKILEIPASSQTLVFSTTSLQLSRISPSSPRALYFNEDVYIGYVLGGRIEVIGIDPDLGAIFYIFDVPRETRSPRIERSERCMNCHVNEDTRFIPGLVLKSVVPGPTGGSLDAFRQQQSGHGIPFDQRFGGWYVTGKHRIEKHWGNLIGRLSPQGLSTSQVKPGERFDFDQYLVDTSDILAHLVLEHQVGFVNRAIESNYRARSLLQPHPGEPSEKGSLLLDQLAHELTRYILFADEIALPTGGIEGDPQFKTDFLRHRRRAENGASLKDFDLQTRLFKYRCSYMIYSTSFQGLLPPLQQRVFRRIEKALSVEKPDPEFSYLPDSEKREIAAILRDTLPEDIK